MYTVIKTVMPDSENFANIIIIVVGIEETDSTVHVHAVHAYLDIF